MTRSAAVTVRRPGLSRAPATSTRTCFQVDPVKQLKKGNIQSARMRGRGSTMIRVPAPSVHSGRATRSGRGDHDDGDQNRRNARPHRGLYLPARRCRGRARQPRLHALQPAHPVARLRPTGDGDKVQVMWWRETTWAAPGDFGPVVMLLDQALQFIATEGFFWINA